jgi:hypothetical protein
MSEVPLYDSHNVLGILLHIYGSRGSCVLRMNVSTLNGSSLVAHIKLECGRTDETRAYNSRRKGRSLVYYKISSALDQCGAVNDIPCSILERRGSNIKDFRDSNLKDTARFWPLLSCMSHIRSIAVEGYLAHKKPPLGRYSMDMPRPLRCSEGGGRFLMSEVPLYRGSFPWARIPGTQVLGGWVSGLYEVPHSQENATPKNPTVGLCQGSLGSPMGVGVFL